MSRLTLHRRTLLTYLGLASVCAPRRLWAKPRRPTVPTRFVGLWHANGWRVLPRDHSLYKDPVQAKALDQMFFPARARKPSHALATVQGPWPEAIAPLARHQGKIAILDGLANPSNGWAQPHPYGAMTFFSGARPIPGQVSSGGPTLDHHLALRDRTRLSGLHLGVGQRVPRVRISHAGPGQPNLSQSDPHAAYATLFSPLLEGDPDKAQLAALRARNKSVLDQNAKELQALLPALSSDDRARLEAHTQMIRQAERRLDATPRDHAACVKTTLPNGLDPYQDAHTPEISQVMLDLMTAALACDLTRVGTMFFGYSTGSFVPVWLGGIDPLHVMSHWPHADARQAIYARTLGWISGQVASLLDRLDAIQEADGRSLLDHSLLMWGTDVGSGQLHTLEDIPVILAGTAAGRLRTGWVHTYEQGTPINRLHLAVADALGAPVRVFGEPDDCTDGPLKALFSS